MDEKTKVCPYCAETIKAEAIVCKYCHQGLAGTARPVEQKKSNPWLGLGGLFCIVILCPLIGLMGDIGTGFTIGVIGAVLLIVGMLTGQLRFIG